MALSQQEIDMFYQGAITNYIFKFAFESRNPGMEFDIDSWIKALNEAASSNDSELNIMNQVSLDKIAQVLNNLDFYKKPINSTIFSADNFKVF